MTTPKTHVLEHGGTLVQMPPPPGAPSQNVIICPGGGYTWLSPREGEPVGEAFREAGWAPWILHYRTGEGLGMVPVRQLAHAVALVRQSTVSGPLVVCGFSAGGHLAGCLGVHGHTLGLPVPDALILCYPVITAGRYAHAGSMRQLAGSDGDTGFFSLEKHVTAKTPPTFLWHTVTDQTVSVQNSLCFAGALETRGVPFELHLFHRGVHGLSLATPDLAEPEKQRHADPHVARWLPLCLEWLAETV